MDRDTSAPKHEQLNEAQSSALLVTALNDHLNALDKELAQLTDSQTYRSTTSFDLRRMVGVIIERYKSGKTPENFTPIVNQLFDLLNTFDQKATIQIEGVSHLRMETSPAPGKLAHQLVERMRQLVEADASLLPPRQAMNWNVIEASLESFIAITIVRKAPGFTHGEYLSAPELFDDLSLDLLNRYIWWSQDNQSYVSLQNQGQPASHRPFLRPPFAKPETINAAMANTQLAKLLQQASQTVVIDQDLQGDLRAIGTSAQSYALSRENFLRIQSHLHQFRSMVALLKPENTAVYAAMTATKNVPTREVLQTLLGETTDITTYQEATNARLELESIINTFEKTPGQPNTEYTLGHTASVNRELQELMPRLHQQIDMAFCRPWETHPQAMGELLISLQRLITIVQAEQAYYLACGEGKLDILFAHDGSSADKRRYERWSAIFIDPLSGLENHHLYHYIKGEIQAVCNQAEYVRLFDSINHQFSYPPQAHEVHNAIKTYLDRFLREKLFPYIDGHIQEWTRTWRHSGESEEDVRRFINNCRTSIENKVSVNAIALQVGLDKANINSSKERAYAYAQAVQQLETIRQKIDKLNQPPVPPERRLDVPARLVGDSLIPATDELPPIEAAPIAERITLEQAQAVIYDRLIAAGHLREAEILNIIVKGLDASPSDNSGSIRE